MLVSSRELLHRVDVQAALVRERSHAHIRRADVVRDVGHFIHKMREVAQLREIDADIDAHF